MISRDPTFARAFVARANELFAKYPGIDHQWHIDADEDGCTLLVPKSSASGFDVYFDVCAEEVVVNCEAFHEHHLVEGDLEEYAANCVGMLYDLLSPAMRIRESFSGETPHKWTLEMFEGGKWVSQGSTGLFCYNYFAKRSEVLLQNKFLEARPY